MSIELKIHQGTGRLTGTSLCRTCAHGMHWQDRGGEHSRCSMLGKDQQPRGEVRECSEYYSEALPALRDLREIAWELKTDKQGRGVGFTPPKRRGEE